MAAAAEEQAWVRCLPGSQGRQRTCRRSGEAPGTSVPAMTVACEEEAPICGPADLAPHHHAARPSSASPWAGAAGRLRTSTQRMDAAPTAQGDAGVRAEGPTRHRDASRRPEGPHHNAHGGYSRGPQPRGTRFRLWLKGRARGRRRSSGEDTTGQGTGARMGLAPTTAATPTLRRPLGQRASADRGPSATDAGTAAATAYDAPDHHAGA